MGQIIQDNTTTSMLHQMNTRFAAGDAITEMAALHNQFTVFAPTTSLKDTFNLLAIAPDDPSERRRWFHFLDVELRRYPSDIPGMDGHARVVKAYHDNLTSPSPLPVYTTTHLTSADPRVVVTQDKPIAYIPVDHIVISIPTRPRDTNGPGAAPARIARQRRVARGTFPSDK